MNSEDEDDVRDRVPLSVLTDTPESATSESSGVHESSSDVNGSPLISVSVRIAGESDLHGTVVRVFVLPFDTVGDLVRLIRSELKLENSTKRVRLILHGKVLRLSETIESAKITSNVFIHAAISDTVVHTSNRKKKKKHKRKSGRRSNDISIDMNELTSRERLRGFDRLASFGYNRAAVQSLRAQFYSAHAANDRNTSSHGSERTETVLTEEQERERRLDNEDEWVDNYFAAHWGSGRGDLSGAARGLEEQLRVMQQVEESGGFTDEAGTTTDLLGGLIMGFTMSFIMLFFFSSVSTRSGKYGVLSGIVLNCAFGLFRALTLALSD